MPDPLSPTDPVDAIVAVLTRAATRLAALEHDEVAWRTLPVLAHAEALTRTIAGEHRVGPSALRRIETLQAKLATVECDLTGTAPAGQIELVSAALAEITAAAEVARDVCWVRNDETA